jgi:hypothetical protein
VTLRTEDPVLLAHGSPSDSVDVFFFLNFFSLLIHYELHEREYLLSCQIGGICGFEFSGF